MQLVYTRILSLKNGNREFLLVRNRVSRDFFFFLKAQRSSGNYNSNRERLNRTATVSLATNGG